MKQFAYAAVAWLAFFLVAPVVIGILLRVFKWWMHLVGWWWTLWIY